MNKYNTIIKNDVANGEGVCVSFFVQGCPHHCEDCFNPETWDFNSGKKYTEHTKWEIIEAIGANGIQRNFSILGGEPLAEKNLSMTEEIIRSVRAAYPDIKIFLWSGYTLEEILLIPGTGNILNLIDVLVDGPFISEQKDLSLKLRGSRNQHIYERIGNKWELIE